MSTVIPTILHIPPVDSHFGHTVNFTYFGFRQKTGSHMVIRWLRPDGNEEIVYSFEIASFAREHPIPPNILVNGNRYNVEIRVIHADGTYSGFSNRVPFLALTRPVIDITSISGYAEVFARDVSMVAEYSQAEGEQVRTYRFTLLDENRDSLTQFPTRTPTDPNVFIETIPNLERGRGYFIKIQTESVNGQHWDHTEHFNPLYIRPDASGIIHMENDDEEGFVRLTALLKQITGSAVYALPLDVDITEKNEYEVQQRVRSGEFGNSGFEFQDNMVIIPENRPIIFRELNFGAMSNFTMRWAGMNVPNGTLFLELRPRGGDGGTIMFYKYSDRIIARQFVNGVVSTYMSHNLLNIPDDRLFTVGIRGMVGRLDIVHQIL